MSTKPYLVNGEWRTGRESFEVNSKWDGSVVAEVGVPTEEDVEEAVATAASTFEESQHLPIHARADALDHISRRLSERIDRNAEMIAQEGGKPLKWAKVEATRAVSTFRWASEVIRHGDDELMRLDTEASLGSRIGLIRRFAAARRTRRRWRPPAPSGARVSLDIETVVIARMSTKPYLVNGEWRTGREAFEVKSPWDGSVVAEVGVPTEEDVEEAIATAASTFEESQHLPIHARADDVTISRNSLYVILPAA